MHSPLSNDLPPFLKRIDPWIKISQLTYRIPAHGRSFFYTLGGIVFFGFLLMIATGLLLAQLYNPAPDFAFESLQNIQQIGWASFLRAFHYWTAQGIIIALLIHVSRVFITGAYQHPRQVTWWIGVALLAIMLMGSYFSGTILKWDEEGFDALAHYRDALSHLGPIGAVFIDSIPGSGPINFRIYVSHIAGFPLLLIFLMVFHFYLIRTFNLSPTPKDPWATAPLVPEEEMKGKFNEHAVSIGVFSILYYGWIAVLAFFVRAPLGGPPMAEHAPLKPPWPFLWMYGFENVWGVVATLFASSTLFGILALVPLLDRGRDRRFAARKGILALGAMVALSLVGLTLHGYLTKAQSHTSHTHGVEEKDSHSDTPHHDEPNPDSHNDAAPNANPSHPEGEESHHAGE